MSSVAQLKSVIGVLVIMISTGARVSCKAMPVPEPMWMHRIVPVSEAACQIGSQYSS